MVQKLSKGLPCMYHVPKQLSVPLNKLPSSRISEPDAEIAEEAKEEEKETLSDKKSEPTPIPNKLNLVSMIVGIYFEFQNFIVHIFLLGHNSTKSPSVTAK